MFFSEVTPENAKNLDRDALLQLAECDLADLCRIHIDMHNFCIFRKLLRISGYTVTEACTDSH